jgi:hypothetical protein
MVAVVEWLLPRVHLTHVVAQGGGFRITRTPMQEGPVDRAFLVAHKFGEAVTLQLQRISLGYVALELLLIRIERDGHQDLGGVK